METCAKDAAGASIKASNNANAIFLTMDRVLQRWCVSGSTRALRFVDEFNAARQKYSRNHRMPHLRRFYSAGFLYDDPDCSGNIWAPANEEARGLSPLASFAASTSAQARPSMHRHSRLNLLGQRLRRLFASIAIHVEMRHQPYRIRTECADQNAPLLEPLDDARRAQPPG